MQNTACPKAISSVFRQKMLKSHIAGTFSIFSVANLMPRRRRIAQSRDFSRLRTVVFRLGKAASDPHCVSVNFDAPVPTCASLVFVAANLIFVPWKVSRVDYAAIELFFDHLEPISIRHRFAGGPLDQNTSLLAPTLASSRRKNKLGYC